MYNTKSSCVDIQYSSNSEDFRPQQKHYSLKNYKIPKLASQISMQHKNRLQSIEGVLPKSRYPQLSVQAPIPPSVNPFSEGSVPKDNQKNMLITNNELSDDKIKLKCLIKCKLQTEQKKRLNTRISRLVCPKSPLMVFLELYKDIPIKLVEHQIHKSYKVYSASFEVDGQIYMGDHISKTRAKQKACDNFFRVMLTKKMKERSETKETPFTENELEVNENVTSVIPNGPLQEDFPWLQFASLAMYNLLTRWGLQPIAKVLEDETIARSKVEVNCLKKFPDNPKIYNPVQLFHKMIPHVTFKEMTIRHHNPSVFQVLCKIQNLEFRGEKSTKRAAKRECAIQVIKHFWNFDFNLDMEIIQQPYYA